MKKLTTPAEIEVLRGKKRQRKYLKTSSESLEIPLKSSTMMMLRFTTSAKL